MGLTFKENCPDLRNTRVIDVIYELQDYGVQVDVCDPWVDPNKAKAEYGLDLLKIPENGKYDGIIIAVAHDEFKEMGQEVLREFSRSEHLVYDLKNVLDLEKSDLRL